MTSFSEIFKFSRKEISYIFSHGKFFCRTKGIKILFATYPSSLDIHQEAKLLIVTPRRIGKATERNLVRRRIKEIFYSHKLYLNYSGYFVLFTYPGVTEHSYQDLVAFLTTHFSPKYASQ